MFTEAVTQAELLEIAKDNLKLPRDRAAHLIADNIIQDWRGVIETIGLPTLVFGGEASIHPTASQRWIAETIPGAELEIFPAGEGGSHFLFYENPSRFNARVVNFLS